MFSPGLWGWGGYLVPRTCLGKCTKSLNNLPDPFQMGDIGKNQSCHRPSGCEREPLLAPPIRGTAALQRCSSSTGQISGCLHGWGFGRTAELHWAELSLLAGLYGVERPPHFQGQPYIPPPPHKSPLCPACLWLNGVTLSCCTCRPFLRTHARPTWAEQGEKQTWYPLMARKDRKVLIVPSLQLLRVSPNNPQQRRESQQQCRERKASAKGGKKAHECIGISLWIFQCT